MDHIAVAIAHDLELDVAGPRQVFLDVDFAVAESGQRFRARELERPRKILRISSDAHALTAAPGRSLDDDREADLTREFQRVVGLLNRARSSGNDRDTDVLHGFSGCRFVAHDPDLRGCRPDKVDVRRDARLGEFRVLGEKPVTRMNRVGAGDLRRGNDAGDIEIRFPRRSGPDADIVISEADVQRFAISFRVDRDSLDAQLTASSDNS